MRRRLRIISVHPTEKEAKKVCAHRRKVEPSLSFDVRPVRRTEGAHTTRGWAVVLVLGASQ